MSITPTRTLTLVERVALPTVVPNAYLFNDAVSDAFGWNASEFAGSPALEIDTVFLWENGCKTGDAWDCTKACRDTEQGPEMVWNSRDAMFTLQNCLLYPILASAATQSLLVQDPPGLLEKYGIYTNILDAGLVADAESVANATTYFPVVESCVREFCVDLAGRNEWSCSPWDPSRNNWSGLEISTTGPDYAPWIPQSREETLTGFVPFNLCGSENGAGIPGPLNSDLAGPGVLISYMQQYIIVLATYLFVILNTTWIPAIVSAFCHLTRRHGRGSAKATAERISKKVTSKKQADTLVTALLDFQKSQLFFSVALQVACLYAVYHPAILEARTFIEVERNLQLLTLVGVSGLYPVALNLLSIRAGKKKPNLLTFLLTVCAIALASANWLISASTAMEPEQLTQDGLNLDLTPCGGMNPQKYCVPPDYTIAKGLGINTAIISWQTVALVVPYLAVIYVGVDKYITALFPRLSGTTATAANVILKVGSFIIQIWLVIGVAALLAFVGKLTSFKWISARDKWTFGQIIAVTVWVPCIVEWVRMAFKASRKGSQSASGYAVITKGKNDIEALPGAVDEAHLMQNMGAGAHGNVPTVPDTRRDTSY